MQSTTHPLVGSIVRDTTTKAITRYAVGATGFIILATGDFVSYDSAFPGPDFFADDAFEVEYSERRTMNDDAAEALDTLHWRYTQFAEAKTPVTQAQTLMDLNDAVSDMASYHPGYMFEHEHTMMPWQRTEIENLA